MGGLRARAPAGGQEQGIRSCLSRPRACGLSVHRILAVVDVWPLLHQDEAPSIPQPQRDQTLSLFCKSPFLSTLSQDWAQSPTRGCWKLAPRCSAAPPPRPAAGSVLSSGALLPFLGLLPRVLPPPPPPAQVSGHKRTTCKKPTSHRRSLGCLWVRILVFSFWTTVGRVVRSCFCSLAALLWAEPRRVELPAVLLPVRGLSWGLQWMFSDICPIA